MAAPSELRSIVIVAAPSAVVQVVRRTLELPLAPGAHMTVLDERSPTQLIREIRERDADLVVMAARARGVFRDRRAASVIRRCGRPVLLVRQRAGRPFERVLIALRLGADSLDRDVLAFARVALRGARTAVHACEMWGLDATRQLHREIASQGDPHLWTRQVESGDPRTIVPAVAESTGADVLVMGYRRRSWVLRALLGSVAHDVVRDTRCDVLVVPGAAA